MSEHPPLLPRHLITLNCLALHDINPVNVLLDLSCLVLGSDDGENAIVDTG
jgi:hypothetical protein